MRLILFSDDPYLKTGFGQQIYRLGCGLKKMGHNINFVSNHITKDEIDNMPILSFNTVWPQIVDLIENKTYDALITLCDFPYILRFLDNEEFKKRWIAWFTLDGEVLPSAIKTIYSRINNLCVMSKFSYQNLIPFCNIKYIPPIISDDFYPLSNEKLRTINQLHNKFVVLENSRNQPRKYLPGLIKAWSQFSKDKNDVILLLNTDPLDPAGYNLFEVCKYYGLDSEKIKFTSSKPQEALDNIKLNFFLNLADVRVVFSTGEGGGVSILESIFCQTPIIMPNHTLYNEFSEIYDFIYPYDIAYEFIDPNFNSFRYYPDINSLVQQLEYFYEKKEKKELLNPVFHFRELFSEKNIAIQFNEILNTLPELQHKVNTEIENQEQKEFKYEFI